MKINNSFGLIAKRQLTKSNYRQCATWKMQTYRFIWPFFRYIKIEFPNTIIQVRFYGLMKLQEQIWKNNDSQ